MSIWGVAGVSSIMLCRKPSLRYDDFAIKASDGGSYVSQEMLVAEA